MPINDPQAVHHLNALLRLEFSAVDSYSRALEHGSAQAISALHENLENHSARVRALFDEIQVLGGLPSSSAGAWGSLAALVAGGAHRFGLDAVLAILEEGERHASAVYAALLPQTEATTRELIETVLLPAQIRSRQRLTRLYPGPVQAGAVGGHAPAAAGDPVRVDAP
jgi:hypothetical protein